MPGVLIVDDEKDMREFVKDMLEGMNFEVCEAGDGAEALCKAREVLPDLIVLDIVMPVMTGWEFIKWIRTSDLLKSVPVIIISGSRKAKEEYRAEKPEGCVFLAKPFTVSEFEKNVWKLLPVVKKDCAEVVRPQVAGSVEGIGMTEGI